MIPVTLFNYCKRGTRLKSLLLGFLAGGEPGSAAEFVFFCILVIEVAGEVGLFAGGKAFVGPLLLRDGLAAIDTNIPLSSLFPH